MVYPEDRTQDGHKRNEVDLYVYYDMERSPRYIDKKTHEVKKRWGDY